MGATLQRNAQLSADTLFYVRKLLYIFFYEVLYSPIFITFFLLHIKF